MFGKQRKKQGGLAAPSVRGRKQVRLQCRLKVDSDDDVTNDGKLFHARAAATGKARSPIVLRRSLEQPPPLTSWNADSAASCRHQPRDLCCWRGIHCCCAVKTPEDEGRQLESDPLQNPKPWSSNFSEQWRHVIVLLGTEYYPSSGVEDGLQPIKLACM